MIQFQHGVISQPGKLMDTNLFNLSPEQIAIVEAPLDARIFLEGPAGSGKTTAAVERLLQLMAQGVRGDAILLLVPQRTLGEPYYRALQYPGVTSGGLVSLLTVGGLARRMVDLFWPVVAGQAGFAHPDQPPVFLTLETAQYYMAHLVRPLLDEGLFNSVTLERNRLYSQIIDNLNKAAVVGFPYTEIDERLKSAWIGEPGQLRVYTDVQTCATRFREYCLAHNLLDFSLQVEVFLHHLWPSALCREHLLATYRHLIADNLEEDNPASHDLLREWLPQFESALLVFDQQAGFRSFLGADPQTAYALKDQCEQHSLFAKSFVASPSVLALETSLALGLEKVSGPAQSAGSGRVLRERPGVEPGIEPDEWAAFGALTYDYRRYYPQMLDWVAERIASLVHKENVPPSEIVVLAPFLSDALRFSLMTRLESQGVPARSHRPSRSLREEPVTQCLLTLAALSHPEWLAASSAAYHPTKFDVAYALVQAIEGLDLVRAQLLVEIVYRQREGLPVLSAFERLRPEMQERITYQLGMRYENMRQWLAERGQEAPLEFDHFLSRLFGEVLSQPGYGFHNNFNAGEVAANLIESVQKFRWAAGKALEAEAKPLGQEYLEMVQDGVIAAQYIRSWQVQPEDAILIAPAYTFLMSNRPVDYQFWLDVGSRGWSERLYQPLTHPYVLSRSWSQNKPWTDYDEVEASRDALYRLVIGLVRRCRWKVYLGLSELSEQGYEQRGPLLKAFQHVLRQASGENLENI